jgi:RNA polymerase sigma-70 factor (ECF subfamily)
MANSPEDQALINLWRQGDQDAARQIVERYVDRLLVLARRRISQRLASRIDAEDIVQSVFRTFFVRLKDGRFVFQDEDDLCKLLVRITLHKTLRQVAFHKAAKRDPSLETNQGERHREQLLAVLDREPSAEDALAFEDALDKFLAPLSEQERQIIQMRLQGCTNDEIAQRLGLYDRKIRRLVEHVRDMAEEEGLAELLGVPPADEK